MADLPEQDLWIGSVMQQNLYLHWQDVKDICTKEVSEAYEQTKGENEKLKELLKECKEPLEVLAEKRDACDWYPEDVLAKLYQALGEDK